VAAGAYGAAFLAAVLAAGYQRAPPAAPAAPAPEHAAPPRAESLIGRAVRKLFGSAQHCKKHRRRLDGRVTSTHRTAAGRVWLVQYEGGFQGLLTWPQLRDCLQPPV
jgi:hypothetical protein